MKQVANAWNMQLGCDKRKTLKQYEQVIASMNLYEHIEHLNAYINIYKHLWRYIHIYIHIYIFKHMVQVCTSKIAQTRAIPGAGWPHGWACTTTIWPNVRTCWLVPTSGLETCWLWWAVCGSALDIVGYRWIYLYIDVYSINKYNLGPPVMSRICQCQLWLVLSYFIMFPQVGLAPPPQTLSFRCFQECRLSGPEADGRQGKGH